MLLMWKTSVEFFWNKKHSSHPWTSTTKFSFPETANASIFYVPFQKYKSKWMDFPGGTVVKNPPANAGDTGTSPGPGRSHMPQST